MMPVETAPTNWAAMLPPFCSAAAFMMRSAGTRSGTTALTSGPTKLVAAPMNTATKASQRGVVNPAEVISATASNAAAAAPAPVRYRRLRSTRSMSAPAGIDNSSAGMPRAMMTSPSADGQSDSWTTKYANAKRVVPPARLNNSWAVKKRRKLSSPNNCRMGDGALSAAPSCVVVMSPLPGPPDATAEQRKNAK